MDDYRGSCLCGTVSYLIQAKPKAVTHCHCRMCQKQHGAAFATYASVPRADFHYLSGEVLLASFASSGTVVRKFCSICGTNIEWRSSDNFADWISFTLTTLDTPFVPNTIRQVHLDSKACWLDTPGKH